MADIRINSLPSTATSFNTDDYIAIDGASAGTRKMLAANPPFTDVTLGASGPSVKSTLSARAPRQGLVFDGTGSPTVTVPAVGTADFSIGFWVTPNTSVAYGGILSSVNGGVYLISLTPKILNESSAVVVSANAALTLSKNSNVVYTRSGTTGTWYINGIAAGSGTDSTNYSVAWSYIGSTLVGTLGGLNLYNRALSATEVVALYEAGAPSGADYNSASSTNIITGDAWYTTVQGGTAISSGVATITTPGNLLGRANAVTVGKRYRVSVNITASTGGAAVRLYEITTGTNRVIGSSAGTNTLEFTATSAGQYFNISAGTATFDTISIIPLGLLLAPDAAQAGGGLTWYDTSGNAANITLPASGVSWNVPTSGYVTSGSSLNLAAGGTNQNITLTPSGTGAVVANTASGASIFLQRAGTLIGSVVVAGVNEFALSAAAGKVTNLYANGYGAVALSIQSNGNSLLGKTIDSGNGKLQLADHTDKTGGIGFGTDTALYRYAGGIIGLDHIGGSVPGLNLLANGTRIISIYGASNSLYLDTFNAAGAMYLRTGAQTTALTLDSSQQAKFSSAVYCNTTTQSSGVTGAKLITKQTSGTGDWTVTLDGNPDGVAGNSYGLRILAGTNSSDYSLYIRNQTNTTTLLAVKGSGRVNMGALPTSSTGLSAGDIWNDAGTLKIV
jgi:hypothetical protein